MKALLTKVILPVFFLVFITCGKKSSPGPDEPPTPPTPEIIFCNNFEDGNFSAWDDYDGNPAPDNVLLADPGPRNRPGNHVARLRVKAGRGSADLVKMLPKKYEKVYARWYVQWEPGYDFNAMNHGSGLFAGERHFMGQAGNRPTGANFAQTWFETHTRTHRPYLYTYYRGMYQNCASANGQCWGDEFPCLADDGSRFCTTAAHRPTNDKTPPVLTTGKWYRVEIMMDMGKAASTAAEATGVLNMWIDGVEYGPWNKLWLRTTDELKLTAFWLQLFHHGNHATEGILIDDVVVSNVPIGNLHPCD